MSVFSRRGRATHVVVGLAMLAGVSCADNRDSASTLARVHIVSNGVIAGRDALPVRFQTFNEAALDRLATRERLRELIEDTPRQFEQIRRVQDWVNAQWPDGTPNPYPPWNALIVLDWIRSGTTGGFCAQYAQVFLQSLAALGFTARYVEIGSRENPYAHYLTEVWSNDFDKWVVMDADFNVYFERHGVPLSALEVHDALVSSTLADVQAVFEQARPGHASPVSWPRQTAELYYYVRYHLNANHLSRAGDPSFDRFDDMIEFEDARTTPWEVSAVPTAAYPHVRLTRRRVSDRTVVSAKLNQVHISIRAVDADSVTLGLQDNVLQRDRYEYRVTPTAGPSTPWQSTTVPAVTVDMPDGGALVEVRGVNVRGVAGPSSALAIDPD